MFAKLELSEMRTYPDVHLTAIVEQSRTMDRMLRDGSLDIAVVQVFEDDMAATDVALKRDDLVWIGPKDHTLAQGARTPFVAFDHNCFYRHWADREMRKLGRPLHVVMDCSSVAGVVEAVKSGIGCALVSRARAEGRVAVLSDDFPVPPQVMHVARCHVTTPSRVMRALLKERRLAWPDAALGRPK